MIRTHHFTVMSMFYCRAITTALGHLPLPSRSLRFQSKKGDLRGTHFQRMSTRNRIRQFQRIQQIERIQLILLNVLIRSSTSSSSCRLWTRSHLLTFPEKSKNDIFLDCLRSGFLLSPYFCKISFFPGIFNSNESQFKFFFDYGPLWESSD